MHGGDADQLTVTGQHFLRSSHELLRYRAQLDSSLGSAGWTGADANRSRDEWLTTSAPALLRTSAFMEHLGRRLIDHGAEQRRVSATGLASRARSGLFGRVGDLAGAFVDDLAGDVRDTFDDARDTFDDVLDSVFGRGDHEAAPPSDGAIGLRSATFVAPSDGRGAVTGAMAGLADGDRIRRDEIEIRALDNDRYIVVLPGVTDLSEGFDRFVAQVRDRGPFGVPGAGVDAIDSWADNDEPTVRKMRYAYEAALRDDTTVNEYSVVTIDALQAAGVPAGAEVMLVGHSFGAYTAIDLAADRSFNAAHGASPSGYHVEITHVIAAGAETDWRFDELPAATHALVLNNRFDGVYRAEDLLHGDGDASHAGHVEQNFWGGLAGYGHDEHNYIDWLADTGNDRIVAWLEGVGERYAAGGVRVSARVLDPHL